MTEMAKANDDMKTVKKAKILERKKKVEELEHDEGSSSSGRGSDSDSKEHGDGNSESEDDAPEQKDGGEAKTFEELGLIEPLCEACVSLKFTKPTPIQQEAIPYALKNNDIIGLAQTGSGKTAAFALPILQALYENPGTLFACVLAPTRELAYQISEQFEALGGGMGVRCVTIVGGMDMMSQAVALSKKPHIVVATPGRLVDHLENTKGFSLRTLKYLVMDEADRLLDMDFGPSLDKILKVIPRERHTYLFSATMTSKVEKLQRASLVNPVRVAVSTKYETVSSLLQYFVMVPFVNRDTYLVYLVNELAGQTMIIFARTCMDTQRISLVLRQLGFSSVPLHGQMSQASRLGALNKFKSGARSILVATDVAARGLDIPSVDCVINYDLPDDSKSYIHRVGRTARAGRAGKSIAIVTQYAIEQFLRIEKLVMNGEKMPSYPLDKEAVMLLHQRVGEAQREATIQLKESLNQKKGSKSKSQGISGHRRKRRNGGDDAEEE